MVAVAPTCFDLLHLSPYIPFMKRMVIIDVNLEFLSVKQFCKGADPAWYLCINDNQSRNLREIDVLYPLYFQRLESFNEIPQFFFL